jgi:UDP-glucuronate decarboxylase
MNLNKILAEDIENCAVFLKNDAQKLSGKTILVSGGNGFLCSYFVDLVAHLNAMFLKRPCNIIVVDNLISSFSYKFAHLDAKQYFEFIDHDLTKPLSVDGPVNYIIHGASIASPSYYRKYPVETMNVNVQGTRNLLDLARIKKSDSFIFLSTSEIYGDPDPQHIPTSEDYRGFVSCTGPRACYDESKRFGETLCMNFWRQYGVPIKITRSFNVFGPRLSLEDKRVVPDFISNVLKDEDIILFSDGKATRTFCYVTDSIRGHMRVLLSDNNGEAYNIGNDFPEVTMKDLAETVIRASGKNLKVRFAKSPDKDYTTDNPQRRCPNIKKMHTHFPDWNPEISLESGICRTTEYNIIKNQTGIIS